jgi:hypothetical protein
MTAAQPTSMLNVSQPSRASPLPQWMVLWLLSVPVCKSIHRIDINTYPSLPAITVPTSKAMPVRIDFNTDEIPRTSQKHLNSLIYND